MQQVQSGFLHSVCRCLAPADGHVAEGEIESVPGGGQSMGVPASYARKSAPASSGAMPLGGMLDGVSRSKCVVHAGILERETPSSILRALAPHVTDALRSRSGLP